MRLAIADPPYPPFCGTGGRKNRASRWYGGAPRSATDPVPDTHSDAADWDSTERHLALIADLRRNYDGFCIATTPDGLAAYGPLLPSERVMAWVRPNAMPGSHRLRSCWEAVIASVPAGRRSNIGRGQISNVLVCPSPRTGFLGAKPSEWTHWLLRALSYDPQTDTVDDLFPGSGAVSCAIAAYGLSA